jgi:hypothetical protein
MIHKHRIKPGYEGGEYKGDNVVLLSPTQHAMWHFAEWQRKGNFQDWLAWRGLAQFSDVTTEKLKWANKRQPREAKVLGGKRGAAKNMALYYDKKQGFFSKETQDKAQKAQRNKGAGRFDSQLQSELGKRASLHNKAHKTGAFHDKSIQSACGKKGSKITNSQKWRCTITGYVTTPGPLTKYQRAKGIDTCNRERWELDENTQK